MGDNAPPKPSPGLAPLWTPCDWKPANDEPESPARGQGGHVEESLPVGELPPGWDIADWVEDYCHDFRRHPPASLPPAVGELPPGWDNTDAEGELMRELTSSSLKGEVL